MNNMMTRIFLTGVVSLSALVACAVSDVNGAETKSTDDLRVGSYNIRCERRKKEHPDFWPGRCACVKQVLGDLRLDVFGLQEVCPGQRAYLEKALKDYVIVGEHRLANRKSGEASPVAYRKDRFELEKSGTFWLSEKPEEPGSMSWKTRCSRVCTYAILKDLRTGKRFCFANTHLDHVSELARVKGCELILDRMKSFGAGLPIVFTGDHNCLETSPTAKAVEKVLKNSLYLSATPPKGCWRTTNAWKRYPALVSIEEALKVGPEVRNSSAKSPAGIPYGPRIDYIYVSPGIRVLDHATISVARPGTKLYPSDHFPVAATIRLP